MNSCCFFKFIMVDSGENKRNLISRTGLLILASLACLYACKNTVSNTQPKWEKLSSSFLDSIKQNSDSTYSKPYFTRDFATAIYFVNHLDSTVAQVMKDRDSVIRQVIVTKGKTRVFSARYYGNGQLIEKVLMDKFGQAEGPAKEFFQNGEVRRVGNYRSGLHEGKWKNFDSTGRYVGTDIYNAEGQIVQTIKE